jgi:hypothetical protein
MENDSKIIKVRPNGTLYIEIPDLLNLPSVKDQIAKLMNSSIYKSLQLKKQEAEGSKDK